MEVGTEIHTRSGKTLDLLNPSVHAISSVDIATALSRICRYGGQCPQFYSVAEHSYRVSMLAEEDGLGKDIVLACHLHDASEAYIGDIVRPLKDMLPAYKEIEDRLMDCIGNAYGVDFAKHHDTIKKYDNIMLCKEMMTFKSSMGDSYSQAVDRLGDELINESRKRVMEVMYWKPETASDMWLKELDSLRNATAHNSSVECGVFAE